MALSREEELSFPDFSTPVLDIQPEINMRQYVNPDCYGKGKRLCDFEVPNIPTSCLHLLHGRGRQVHAASILRGAHGRGRAKGHEDVPNAVENHRTEVPSATINSKPEKQGTEDSCEPNGQENHSNERENHSSETENHSSETEDCQTLLPAPPSPPLPWTLLPPCVCQFDGLPMNFDQEVLEDIIAFYSSIAEKEERKHSGQLSIRFRLTSPDICDMLESNMHGTDLFGIGSKVSCRHLPS